MKKYQIIEEFLGFRHAGSKAKNDARDILTAMGFQEIAVKHLNAKPGTWNKLCRQLSYLTTWLFIFIKIEKNSLLLRQHPIEHNQLGRKQFLSALKKYKNVQLISLIHDVELIRQGEEEINSKYISEFTEMVALSDKLIVHNENMKQWFIDYGVSEEKLEVLEIFDYLMDSTPEKVISYSKNIYIAGNLSREKSPYVHLLGQFSNVSFKLLGINYESDQMLKNVDYLGSFDPEDVPNQLRDGFGLVWDGDSIETCSGLTGNYLRYNNPHKLSLYLASGIPVIVWKEAAEANFVLNNGVGFAVDSLFELESIFENLTEEEYFKMVENVRRISTRIQSGQYLKEAVEKIV